MMIIILIEITINKIVIYSMYTIGWNSTYISILQKLEKSLFIKEVNSLKLTAS